MLHGVDAADAQLRLALSDAAARVVVLAGPPCCGKSTMLRLACDDLGLSLEPACIEDCVSHAAIVATLQKKLGTESLVDRAAAVLIDNIDALFDQDRTIQPVVVDALRATSKRVVVTGSIPCCRRIADWKLSKGSWVAIEMGYPSAADAARAIMARVPSLPRCDALALAERYNGHVQAAVSHAHAGFDEDPSGRCIGMDVYEVARRILSHGRGFATTERLASFEPSMLPALLYETALFNCARSPRERAWAKRVFADACAVEDHALQCGDAAMHASSCAVRCHAIALATSDGAKRAMRYNQVLNRGATRVMRTRRSEALFHSEYVARGDLDRMLLSSLPKTPFASRLPAMATMPAPLRDSLKA